MTTQLTLFEVKEAMYEVIYWAFPYDKKGYSIDNYCTKWVEVVDKKKLDSWMECVFKNDERYVRIQVKEL